MAMNCLIVDDVHPILMESLQMVGIGITYLPHITKEEAIRLLPEFEILVVRSKFPIDQQVLKFGTKLQIIARAGAGLDLIDQDLFKAAGIQILHAAEGNAAAVAEHTIGMMLGLLAKIPEANQSVKAGHWEREQFRGRELGSQTVGLLGYGNMGPAVAARLNAFGCKILAYDKYRSDWPDTFAERVDLSTLQKESDIISLHIPLTAETENWIDAIFMGACKKGFMLVNTSRGKIVQSDDLARLLQSGWVGSAALDVWDTEPPTKKNQPASKSFQTLVQMPTVLWTPHVAGWSLESYEKISKTLAEKIMANLRASVVKSGAKSG